ncbi:MoaD/ThiS family protein [Gammaproteobacteria bacterium]|nr:MoaD/ThiS family protein [Gammaproteobacteria bacterium]
MSVSVHYFARIREDIGRETDLLEHRSGDSIADVWQRVAPHRELAYPLLVARNQRHATLEEIVEDGDEIAFFPPITGG